MGRKQKREKYQYQWQHKDTPPEDWRTFDRFEHALNSALEVIRERPLRIKIVKFVWKEPYGTFVKDTDDSSYREYDIEIHSVNPE